jgi:membrane-bound metal-dependent hydrolase YbcI (DUF457 family)
VAARTRVDAWKSLQITDLERRDAQGSQMRSTGSEAVFAILFAASFSHLLNDTIQSLIPAIYPVLKDSFQLNFAQIGLITLTNIRFVFQLCAFLPLLGLLTAFLPDIERKRAA